MLKVTIVEDSAEFRSFLESVFARTQEFTLHEMYATPRAALEGIPKNLPDIVVSDIGMQGMNGIELVSQLTLTVPNLKVVMITVFDDDENVFRALQAGASGYVLKSIAIREPGRFLTTLREVYEGGASMSHSIAQRVLDFFRQSNPALVGGFQTAKQQSPQEQPPSELLLLTPRENEILSLLAQGYSDKELAEKLFLSVYTIRTHNTNIYEKLHVRTRSEAIAKFFRG
jgi:DNA-binding NarL/FixJ family response regulator